MEKPRTEKPLKTCGSQGRDIFEFRVASDGELDLTTPKEPIGEESRQKRTQNTSGKPGVLLSSDTKALGLSVDSTGDYFLLGSSMLPLALKSTSTKQSQGLDGTTVLNPEPGPGPLGLEPLYSDERMPTATSPSRSQAGESDFSSEGTETSRERSRDEMEASNGRPTGLTDPSSSASISSLNKTVTVARRSLLFSPAQVDCVKEDQSMPLPSNSHNLTEIRDHVGPLPRQAQNDELLDELSLSIPTASVTSKCQTKTLKKPDFSYRRGDELDSDDHTIGLPKDNYQPRPSKSRSGHGNEELLIPADYSKRPEAITKKKRKLSRRKTTAFHELIPKEELEEEEDEVINQAGFEAPKSRVLQPVTNQEESHLEDKDNAKVDQGLVERGLESIGKPTESMKPRGRPKKVAMMKPLEHEAPEGEDRIPPVGPTTEFSMPENETGPRLAKQPTESKKQRGRPKKGAAETSKVKSSEAIDASIERDSESDYATSVKQIQKKDRNAGGPTAVSEELIRDSDDDLDAADEGGSVPSRVLQETQGNVIPSKPSEKAASSPSPFKSKSALPETPHKQNFFPKGPDKHSPISSGKVSYRVGLSKRQRIAPLLRIVRKS